MSSPSDLRKRAGNGIEKESPSSPTSRQTTPKVKTKNGGVGVMDILRIVGGLFLLNCLLSYFITNDSVLWGYRPWFVRPAVLMRYLQGPVSLTDAELLAYDGTDPNKPIYVALNGTIYDVTAGSHVYGPGGSYHVFAGKDSARAFITGCFAEDTTADLRGAEWTYISVDIPDMDAKGVTPEQKKLREQVVRLAKQKVQTTIDGWASMFKGEGGKDYFEAGTVKRDPDWLEKTPMRKLCDQAQKSRPKSKNAGNDAGAAYWGN